MAGKEAAAQGRRLEARLTELGTVRTHLANQTEQLAAARVRSPWGCAAQGFGVM